MSSNSNNPTDRFSSLASRYARHRPDYPNPMFDFIEEWADLNKTNILLDIASGTGISARPWLERGYTVIAVEPNDAMRSEAETRLVSYPKFISKKGSAEDTGLDPASVDLICTGQALHWFDADRTRREFIRIGKHEAKAAFFWNVREYAATSFMRAYEDLLCKHAVGYGGGDNRIDKSKLDVMFGKGKCEIRSFKHSDLLSLDEVIGRAESASYWPKHDDPNYLLISKSLIDAFHRHQIRGMVEFVLSAHVFAGRLR
jgi:SAM-dependent methyltransferase